MTVPRNIKAPVQSALRLTPLRRGFNPENPQVIAARQRLRELRDEFAARLRGKPTRY